LKRLLAESGTTVITFFLQIQGGRAEATPQERLDTIRQAWKFRRATCRSRPLGTKYMKGLRGHLNRTSQKMGTLLGYVCRPIRKVGNLVVATVLSRPWRIWDSSCPSPRRDLKGIVID